MIDFDALAAIIAIHDRWQASWPACRIAVKSGDEWWSIDPQSRQPYTVAPGAIARSWAPKWLLVDPEDE